MRSTTTRVMITMMLFLTLTGGAVFATGNQEAEDQSQREGGPVTYLNFSGAGSTAQYLETMRKKFEEQNPAISVQIETVGFNDYFTQLQTRIAAGSAADSFELNYENFVTYAKRNLLLSLNNLFEKSAFDQTILNENALAAFRLDGEQYGLPASFSTVLLFYNKDLFDRAGADYPTLDWNWEAEQRAAEKIRSSGANIFGIFHPIQYWEFYKVVQQNGGSILSADGKRFTINSEKNIKTLQFMVDRVQKSNVMPTEAQLGGAGENDLFKAGRLGMVVTGIWMFPEFTRDIDFNWDIAVEPGNIRKATHFFANGLVINKDSKNWNPAFQWLKFMSAGREAAQIRVDAGWELPASTYPDIIESYNRQTPPEARGAVFQSLDYLVTPPVVEQFGEMADIINLYLQAAKDGNMSPKEALDKAQKELEERITL